MDSNNLNLEVEFVDKTRFEIEYQDLSVINGKSIKKVETVSERTESGGVSVYKIYRDDDLVLGTLYIKNGSKGDKGDTGPQGPQGEKGDRGSDATATPLTDTVTQGDTTHAVTGNAVYTAIQQIRTEIGEAIQYINR